MKSFSCFKPRDPFKLWSKELDKRVTIWAKDFNSSFKLLLLGPAGAGKTTILKQIKIIHFEGFSLEERQQKAKEIRSNLLESVRELTACITASGHQIDWCDKKNQSRLDFINGLNLDDQTYDLYAAKIYDYSKRILTDKGVENLFAQLNQLSITHRSQYLLNRVDEIRNVNYIPNNDDILQSRRKTSDIQKLEFQVKLPVKSGNNIEQTFCMFDVGGQRGERRKWIQVFDGVSAVMFLIDSSSFDAIDDENGRNKLRETIALFHEVWTTRFLLNSNFVLLFNKQDILKKKIARGIKIEDHFPEYKSYKFQPQDRPIHGRSGEKLSLFRTSSSRSTRNSSRSSSVTSTTTSGRAPLAPSPTHPLSTTGLKQTDANNNNNNNNHPDANKGATREKRKSASFYRFGIHRKSNHYDNNRNKQTTTNSSDQSADETSQYTFDQHQHGAHPLAENISKANEKLDIEPAGKQSSSSSSMSAEHLAYLKARSFIRDKFLQVTRQPDNDQRKFSSPNLPMYNSKESRVAQPKRNVCYHYTTATDTDNVRDLFENLQKMVIKSTMKDLAS